MIEVNVTSRGLKLAVVAEKLAEPLKRKLIERMADAAWAAAFYGAPWKTGKLAQSIVKNVGETEASIEALAPYAVYVVKGTAPHEVRPVNASCLAFKAMNGEMIFTRLVHHPGTKPNPFLQRAADIAREKVNETFAELWLELVD